MSAIAGLWCPDGRSAADGLARMLTALRPFGDDPVSAAAGDDVAIGRRLVATLPEDRHDRGPLRSRDQRLHLVADVRLDDRATLAQELGIDAARAREMSDAALLLAALEAWGEAGLDRVFGHYAFALWDAARQRWLLARDALGGRPLHYARKNGWFAFASMPSGLHALPDLAPTVDDVVIAHALELIPPPPGATCFREVTSVPMGHFVAVTREGVRVERHWTPAPAPLRLRGVEAYRAALRDELDQAVARALRGTKDGEVGAQMSSGLDSTAVAATAARLIAPQGRRLTAYTAVPRAGFDGIGPPGRRFDEGPVAAEVAGMHANIDHVLIDAGSRSPFDALDRIFHLYQQPILNLCNGTWSDAIFDEARARGQRVMLMGQMGNHTLSFRGIGVIHGLIRQGRWRRAAAELIALRRRGAGAGRLIGEILGPGAATRLRRGGARSEASPGPLLEGRRAGLDAHGDRIGDVDPRGTIAGRIAAMERPDQACRRKGILAAWRIDERDPTADRRFVEFCLSLPDGLLLHRGMPAALVRLGLTDRLPAAVLTPSLRGLQAADWHLGLSREGLLDKVDELDRSPGVAALLDVARLRDWALRWDDLDWSDPGVDRRYRHQMLRAISFADFLARGEAAGGSA